MIHIRKQSGAVLMIALITIASVLLLYFINRYAADERRVERESGRVESMARAKEALIAYAVNYIDDPLHNGEMGFMPCPDYVVSGLPEGEQESLCAGTRNVSVIGQFPWRTFELPPQLDESNECLWYAVSGYYKHTNRPPPNDKTEMLNEDSNGQFELYDSQGNLVYGANPQDRVVALIISPGGIVGNQVRNKINPTETSNQCGLDYTPANYLDGNGVIDNSVLTGVADTVDNFITAGTDSASAATPFNDIILPITHDDLWNAVKRRNDFNSQLQTLTENIAGCMLRYGNAGTSHHLPWPAAMDLSAGTGYRDSASYTDQNAPATLIGRLADEVDDSEAQLAAGGGGAPGGGAPGGGPGGGAPSGPPGGGPACAACWADYQAALANAQVQYNGAVETANLIYTSCINRGRNPTACNAQLNNDMRKAQFAYDQAVAAAVRDYNACIRRAGGCTTGGGTTAKGIANILQGCPLLDAAQQTLWSNWKDHFFYVVSQDFAPDSANAACNGNCITVGGINRAAAIIFSGNRLANQTRNDPVTVNAGVADTDTRNVLTNYLEGNNALLYPGAAGSGVYTGTPTFGTVTGGTNDFIVCINDGANLTQSYCQ